LTDLDDWIGAGQTATARFVRRMRDDEAKSGGERPRPDPPLLDAVHHAAWIDELSDACDADPGFTRHPTWRGAPAETGALARLQSDPLIGALTSGQASRVVARFVARLRELALLLAGRHSAVAGAKSLATGGGIAWVENARGLLVHRMWLDQDRVRSYDIVAPTEWNFHPAGALALALAGAPAGDLEALRERTNRLVHSLDPCVACHVEFDNA
jgi:Ni,Fe-hydrogenase I large subunit